MSKKIESALLFINRAEQCSIVTSVTDYYVAGAQALALLAIAEQLERANDLKEKELLER